MKQVLRGIYAVVRTRARRNLLRSLQSCREMVPLMSNSLDRRLTMSERLSLKLHFLVCNWCALYLAQLKLVQDSLRQGELPPVSTHEFTAEMKGRMKSRLKESRSDEGKI